MRFWSKDFDTVRTVVEEESLLRCEKNPRRAYEDAASTTVHRITKMPQNFKSYKIITLLPLLQAAIPSAWGVMLASDFDVRVVSGT